MTDIVKRLRDPVLVERNDGIRLEAADEVERLREALDNILHCTPHVRDGAIIYDCGDPFEIARAARQRPGRA